MSSLHGSPAPDLRARIRTWISDHLRSEGNGSGPAFYGAGESEAAIEAGRQYLSVLAEKGLSQPSWPSEYGGGGFDEYEARIVQEELAAAGVPDLYQFSVGLAQAGSAVLQYGTEEQKRRLLPAICNGKDIWTQLFSEPEAGSDLAALTTRAERTANGWVINGQKVWSSRAMHATRGLLLARTDVEVSKHAGLSAFVVDMTVPGVEVRLLRQMNGDAHFSEVFLRDVYIDDRDLLGEPGQGWRIATSVLMNERTKSARTGTGTSAELEEVEKLLALAVRCGGDADPLVRQRLAQLYIDASLTDWTARRVASTSGGGKSGPESSGFKLRRSRFQKGVADAALEVLGLEGTLDNSEWATMYLTAPSISIRGGTDEVQRTIIGERVLGLEPEPRVDKGIPFSSLRRSSPIQTS